MSEQLLKISVFCLFGVAILAHIFWHASIRSYFVKQTNSTTTVNQKTVKHYKEGETITIYYTKTGRYIPCSIDKLTISEMSQETFRGDYYLKKPLIIIYKNESEQWLKNPKKWEPMALVKRFDSYTVTVIDGVNIDRTRANGRLTYTTEIIDFLEMLIRMRLNINDTRYIYSKEFFDEVDYQYPINYPATLSLDPNDYENYFFMGGDNSGIQFQRSTDAFLGIVEGRQQIFLYQPSDPNGIIFGIYDPINLSDNILKDVTFNEKPMECVLEQNELLYIPEGYYHSTLTSKFAIAIKSQRVLPKTKGGQIFQSLNSAFDHKYESLLWKALKQYPNNTELLHKQAVYLLYHERYKESCVILENLYKKYPKFLLALLDYAEIKAKHEMKALEAISLFQEALQLEPTLWETYARYGDFLLNFYNETLEAIDMFEKGTNHKPNRIVLWQFLKTAYDLLNNKTGSKNAYEKISSLSDISTRLVDF